MFELQADEDGENHGSFKRRRRLLRRCHRSLQNWPVVQGLLQLSTVHRTGIAGGGKRLRLGEKGHDLRELLEELVKYRGEYERFRDEASMLDQYYIPTRYANAFHSGSAAEHYTKRQAEEALKAAGEIFQELKNLVTERTSL